MQTDTFRQPNQPSLDVLTFDAGAHRRCKNAGTNVLTLSGSGLSLDNSAHECVEVLAELLSTEGSLTDNAVNDVGLIETVLDLTCLSLGKPHDRYRGLRYLPSG